MCKCVNARTCWYRVPILTLIQSVYSDTDTECLFWHLSVYSDTGKVTILWHLDVTDTRHNQLRILYSGGVRRMVEGCRYGIFPTINILVTMQWFRSIIWPRGIVYVSFHEWGTWTLWSSNQAGTPLDIVTHHRSNSEQHESCSSHWTNIIIDKWLVP